MKSTESSARSRAVAVMQALGLAAILASAPGCGSKAGRNSDAGSGEAAPGAGGTNRAAVGTPVDFEVRLAALTNQLATAQLTQSEVISNLLARINQLERRDAERVATIEATQKASAGELLVYKEQSQKLNLQVAELKQQVGLLEAGRVLPEIKITPDDGPTTRELDQQLRIAERKNELAAEAAEARAKEQPQLSIGEGGIALRSADTNFVLRLRGELQLDTRLFADDNPHSEGNDTFLLRRARPIMEGTLFRDFSFAFVPDFGGSSVQIFDAWLNYKYNPALQLKAGKFKGPVGLEQLQADTTLPFNERGLPSDLVPIRNVGVSLWGEVGQGVLSYAVGAFNVTGDSRNSANADFGDDKEFSARLFVSPFKTTELTALQGLGFGLGGSYSQVNSNASALPSTIGGKLPGYFTSAQQQFFAYNPVNGTVVADGAQWRLSPQLSYLIGPFGLLGEYTISHQSVVNSFTTHAAALEHSAWQLSAQWVLTGEKASFTGITPLRNFNPRNGGWGAWQLVGRLGGLSLDDKTFPEFSNPDFSAHSATAWSVGINWWLNKNVRVLTSFSRTSFSGGGASNPLDANSYNAPATVTAQNENVFFTRLQLAF